MKRHNFVSMQTDWMPIYHVSQGMDIRVQKEFETNAPERSDYPGDSDNTYTQAVNTFYSHYKFQKVGLDGPYPLWGCEPGWKLMYPTLGNTTKFYIHNELRFFHPIRIKNDSIGGIIANYEIDNRGRKCHGHYTNIDNIAAHFKSNIPGYDAQHLKFDWANPITWDHFSSGYSDLSLRMQFRRGCKGWILSGIMFDKVFWNPRDIKPRWIEFN